MCSTPLVERLLVAVEVEDAAFAAIVVDRLVGHDLLEGQFANRRRDDA